MPATLIPVIDKGITTFLRASTRDAPSMRACLAAATVTEVTGRPAMAWKTPAISRALREAQDAGEERKIIERFVRMPLLLIDDLGTEKLTDSLYSLLHEIIDGRYDRDGGGLIVTSNLSLDDLAEKMGDDRISSRLSEMCQVFSLEGEKDHRLGDA